MGRRLICSQFHLKCDLRKIIRTVNFHKMSSQRLTGTRTTGMMLEWPLLLLRGESKTTSTRTRTRLRDVQVKKSPFSTTKMQAMRKKTVKSAKKMSWTKSKAIETTAKIAVKKVMPTQKRMKTMLLNPCCTRRKAKRWWARAQLRPDLSRRRPIVSRHLTALPPCTSRVKARRSRP